MNRAQFQQAAIEHLDACFRLALQLTRRADEASDLVQEAYLRALRHIDQRPAESFTETGGGVRSWLFTILHNTFYSSQARRAKGPAFAPEVEALPGAPAAADPPPDEPPPAWDLRSLDWEHVDGRLKGAIEDLSVEHREVLLLWGVEGMKYREIASILGVPIGTVMSRLHRARAILAQSLEEVRAELGWRKGDAASN
jgi:RNA polymerase sigma-70 factor (ECF subfamily)